MCCRGFAPATPSREHSSLHPFCVSGQRHKRGGAPELHPQFGGRGGACSPTFYWPFISDTTLVARDRGWILCRCGAGVFFNRPVRSRCRESKQHAAGKIACPARRPRSGRSRGSNRESRNRPRCGFTGLARRWRPAARPSPIHPRSRALVWCQRYSQLYFHERSTCAAGALPPQPPAGSTAPCTHFVFQVNAINVGVLLNCILNLGGVGGLAPPRFIGRSSLTQH